jgi:hypothetical protein
MQNKHVGSIGNPESGFVNSIDIIQILRNGPARRARPEGDIKAADLFYDMASDHHVATHGGGEYF